MGVSSMLETQSDKSIDKQVKFKTKAQRVLDNESPGAKRVHV